ncbi:MAG TPA: hypothetical protein VIP05_22690, partial [Burkholderiaceae bacterium]
MKAIDTTPAADAAPGVPTVVAGAASPLATGAIVLRPDQQPQAQAALAALDFETIAPADIVTIGMGAEQSLTRTLDGFLARLDKKSAAKVFDLFGRLQKGVEDANLPEILAKVQKGEDRGGLGGMFNSFVKRLTGKNADDAAREFMEELTALITGRTRTLASEMQKLEGELAREMQALSGELRTMEQLKQKYA